MEGQCGMANDERLQRLLDRHGRTFADEMGIRLKNKPADLFQLLVGSLLMSARIGADIAMSAARALFDHGFTTAQNMADASWQQRVDALGEGSYVRYDESTSNYLGETSELLLERYDGDLRKLRDAADRDPDEERRLLKQCKGMGDVGANIFFREAQAVWPELRPFADDATLKAARKLDLGKSPKDLAKRYGRDDLSRLAAALVRCDLANDYEAVKAGRDEGAEPVDDELERLSKTELYERAKEQDVPGRSGMSKAELVDALRG